MDKLAHYRESIKTFLRKYADSILQEIWFILNGEAKNEQSSSDPENTLTRDHSAFLSGYPPEDEGLYDDY